MSDDSPGIDTELNRDIGIVGAIALGVGTMIAAGIFVLSGLAVSNVGAAAIVSFLIAAVVASFTAFAYAEFASIYPESGGGYMYVANVFDTDLTYIVGWSMILGYPASAAFYLASFSDWFFRFIYPVLDVPAAVPYWVSGLVVLAGLVAINLKGTEETGMFQIVVTALKVALILLFLVGGLQALEPGIVVDSMAENTDSLGDLRNIGLTSALVFITFFGFEAIATNAEEIEEPGTTVPRAIFISMGLVTVIYTLVVLVVVLAINDGQFLSFLADRVELGGLTPTQFVAENGEVSMGRAAQYYLGDFGFFVIIVGALFSMLSAANATILAGSRVKLAMARRDHLPHQFEALHPDLDTPYRAVLLTGTLIAVYVAVFSVVFGEVPGGGGHPLFGLHLGIESLAHFADFMLLIGLVAVNVAIVRSRNKHPEIDRGFEVPGVPWLPALAVVANLALLVNVEPKSFAIGVLAQAIGVAFWFGVLSGRTREPPAEETEVTAAGPATHEGYEVVVPVANPDHVPQLMRTADDLAAEHGGGVHVVSVVELPAQTPLSEGRERAAEQEPVLERAMEVAADAGVEVSASVRIGHDVAGAILTTLQERDADAVLLGWHGDGGHRRRDIILGTTVDAVVREAPCDVLVERIGEDGDVAVESILLPTAGGPHATYAVEVCRAVARAEGARVRVVNVVDPDASEAERRRAGETVGSAAAMLEDVSAETAILEGEDVVDAIVAETSDHDLVVVGATREGLLQQLVFGAVPEGIARRSATTVIMTKRYIGITSKLRQWLRWQ